MNNQRIEVKKVISSLSSFYNDIKLLIDELKKAMSQEGFKLHPAAGNQISWGEYSVSNSLEKPNQWLLKGIQLCFVPKEIDKNASIDKAIFFSISLYPSSAFEYPVLLGWISNFCYSLDLEKIYSQAWGSKQIWDIDSIDSSWRLADASSIQNTNVIHLGGVISEVVKRIDLLVFDLMSINEKSTLIRNVIQPILKLFRGESLDFTNNESIVSKIPDRLIEKWSQKSSMNDIEPSNELTS